MKKLILSGIVMAAMIPSFAAGTIKVNLIPQANPDTISRMIYGQFAEHLGSCVYEGIWVGKDSPIPNTDGYRNDVLQAVKELRVPVLRWPGGCFADDYHWRDGIGDPAKRPTLINNNWGGTKEDNSFGTHEFFNFCELTGIEPYLSVNIGSGTVQEAAQWIEYVTAENGPMADLRKSNGREKPWRLKYTGIGNESWGCGGEMRPEFYADNYRRYSVYMRNQPKNKLFRIASGASDYDFNWTEVVMDRIGTRRMDGISLHYYTVTGWSGSKGSATDFDVDLYYSTLGKALGIQPVLERHIAIMNEKDPKGKVGLMVDEWGTWFDEEPGSVPGHLFQQNTMRDAMVAALSLDVFHRYAKRVRMTNIAQLANVLQAMWLTKGEKMILTPTYYVYKLYRPHMDAAYIPMSADGVEMIVDSKGRIVPAFDMTASRAKDGSVAVSLVNPVVDKSHKVEIALPKGFPTNITSAEILVGSSIHAHNTFENPDAVKTVQLKEAKVRNGVLTVELPAVSIATVVLK